MAIPTTGLLSNFLAGETASFALPSHTMLARPPLTLRLVRSATSATVSQPPTGKQPRGIMRPRRVSPEMQALVGVPEISRTQALKQIWAYIKENNLQDPQNKKIIICDEKLKKIFAGKDQIGFLEVAGLISPHFLK
ncbi:upstream activation factor subunit UAF30-like [Prosopis cineraria]|uniref:upstream activation factor subunit UAF30-like n=1 Tax=Prosopis cineraria TaxID=364024 RepID=UPI0024108059|nr:upstream activation factor subunit UAF30-like [Prosopis cineraria]